MTLRRDEQIRLKPDPTYGRNRDEKIRLKPDPTYGRNRDEKIRLKPDPTYGRNRDEKIRLKPDPTYGRNRDERIRLKPDPTYGGNCDEKIRLKPDPTYGRNRDEKIRLKPDPTYGGNRDEKIRLKPDPTYGGNRDEKIRLKPDPTYGGEREDEPFVSLSDLTEIELIILRRMREFTIGEHSSVFHGAGFDFVGLRDWQAGDRFESIDWPQSTLTNFSPLIVREFEQPSTSGVVIVADASKSTRSGAGTTSIASVIARAIGTIGMSAVFFQDSIGVIVFDDNFRSLSGLPPRIGKNQVIHCLDAYQNGQGLQSLRQTDSLSATLGGFMRKAVMMPVVSDFLFDDAGQVLGELARLNSQHDVFIMMVDASFAFEMPRVSAGWVEAFDVETGRTRVMSRGELRRMAGRVRGWQDEVARMAKGVDLDVVRLGTDQTAFDLALMEFVIERRLRRK